MTGTPENLRQSSNGIGVISGASIGAGFWLQGKPHKGYVLRGEFTNYSYSYRTTEGGTTLDAANFVERRFMFRFGSFSRIGGFIIGGTLGLGVEMNPKRRCINEMGDVHEGCNAFELRTRRALPPQPYSVKGTVGSAVIDLFNISLGIAF
jgi:hypothetical protein